MAGAAGIGKCRLGLVECERIEIRAFPFVPYAMRYESCDQNDQFVASRAHCNDSTPDLDVAILSESRFSIQTR